MRNYKIARVSLLNYIKPINFFYKDPKFTKKSYKEQQRILFNHFFVYGDSFSHGMKSLNNDAIELIADLEITQKTWAKENNLKYDKKNWKKEILFAQINKFKPDILYFQDIYTLHYDDFKNLKTTFPFLKLIILFRGFPGFSSSLLKHLKKADIILVGSPHLYYKCKNYGLNTYLTYHFFDERILDKINIDKIEKNHNFTFIGSSGYGYETAHLPRYLALVHLLKNTNIELWIDELIIQDDHFQKITKSKMKILTKNFLKLFNNHILNFFLQKHRIPLKIKNLINEILSERHPTPPSLINSSQFLKMVPLFQLFPDRCQNSIFGLDMYKKIAESKITFNIHTLPAQGFVDNMRMFQATGMGTCLLTDNGSNINDLFEIDKEIVIYECVEECIEKVDFLLKNEEKIKEIANNGQKKVLKNHTHKIRCQEINDIIQKSL